MIIFTPHFTFSSSSRKRKYFSHAVTVKCRTTIKALFVYLNVCLGVKLDSLSCWFTSISSILLINIRYHVVAIVSNINIHRNYSSLWETRSKKMHFQYRKMTWNEHIFTIIIFAVVQKIVHKMQQVLIYETILYILPRYCIVSKSLHGYYACL